MYCVRLRERFILNYLNFFRNDFPEVLHYLITTNKCDPLKIDEKGRTLVFLAVVNNLPKILNYLVKRVSF